MGLVARVFYEIECDHEDCGLIEDVLLSDFKEAIEELKDEGWIFDEDKMSKQFHSNKLKNKTYCSHECKKEATS